MEVGLGAGVHAPPPTGSRYSYPESERPPLGRELAHKLAGITKFSERYPNVSADNLQRVAFDFELDEGRNRTQLVKAIAAAVQTGKKPSPVVRALAALDFPLVITTNYDRLFERALHQADKMPFVTVYKKDRFAVAEEPDSSSVAEPFLFKIHGDIKHEESVVVTDEDYIHFILRMNGERCYHPVPDTLLYHFKKWTTLFVGYSLLDYNLRLLLKTLLWPMDNAKLPSMFSVDPNPDTLLVKVYGRKEGYVTFIAQDVWTFVPELYRQITGKEMPE